MVTGRTIHFDWEIFNVSHPGYVVLIISGGTNNISLVGRGPTSASGYAQLNMADDGRSW